MVGGKSESVKSSAAKWCERNAELRTTEGGRNWSETQASTTNKD